MTRPLFVIPNENINLLTGKPRTGDVPAPVPPTPAEHVLLAQAVARASKPRWTNVIDRALEAGCAWLAKAHAPWPKSGSLVRYVWHRHRMPRIVARRLVPFALALVAALSLLAVEAGVWRVG